MAISVQMPALGESVTEGTVTRWLKQEGDTVELDEPLLEVSTDKVDTEIPSPAAGVLTKIVAQEDDTVEIGGELAVIGDAGEAPAAAPAPEGTRGGDRRGRRRFALRHPAGAKAGCRERR
ncbi:dihydrolipoamide acetyltransferase [Mycolicibacterium neworleansense]|uniref:Dihydrolipoyllysine-residue acetyltransferase component of pyruvate dehydrogenase complex n=1 Tax=Mycolicibacterium neworleansense TaxID=146018 RepID=A0A0H5RJS1_9MYCO|nr:dihydrolipoamide acetyltransferase [Mycolicibacterium neworleansense]